MSFKRNIVGLGVALTSFALLTGCNNTVDGTNPGTVRDAQNVHAVAPEQTAPAHKKVVKKKVKKHHHHHAKTTKQTVQSDATNGSVDKTSTTTTNTETTTENTNPSTTPSN